MRKAKEGGKTNELLTVHNQEVKNASMNRHYPPDDDEWKDCEANSQSHVPASPAKVHDPSTTNSAAGSADNNAIPGALWPEASKPECLESASNCTSTDFATSWREFRVP